MSLIPGITGQKTELFDGAKIDALTEYTSGNGVQHQGRTNGVAIEAGKVGELKNFTLRTVAITNAGTWYANSSELTTLTAGVWLIYIAAAGGNSTYAYAAQVATSVTGGAGALLTQNVAVPPIAAGIGAASSAPIVYVATSSTPIYAQGYCQSGGSTGINISGQAIRIA